MSHPAPPPPAVGVLVVHGIGVQRPDFAGHFVAAAERRLAALGVEPGRVGWQAGYWADLLAPREEQLWAQASRGGDLDWTRLRRFVINAFGDALAYQREPDEPTDVYRAVHGRVRAALAALRARLGGDRPLVVVAHSLGSVIVSNYVWDAQRDRPAARATYAGATAFERGETLAGLVTCGSPIALFTLALARIESIAFPPRTLAPPLAAAARWLNVYDPDDVLAYPLRTLSPSYAAAVSADRAVNVGGVAASWNPAAHTAYFDDADVVEPVAGLVRDVVVASRGA